jgi:hypothetical protein
MFLFMKNRGWKNPRLEKGIGIFKKLLAMLAKS